MTLTALSGCASAYAPKSDPYAFGGIRPNASVEGLEFFPQTEHHCGPAALAMLATGEGLPLSPEEAERLVYLPGREGSLTADMLGGARRHGLLTYRLTPRFSDLLREVQQGHAVLVLQNRGLSLFPLWHYAAITGFDLSAETVTLRSGDTPRESMSFTTFLTTWERSGNWSAVLLAPQKYPATAESRRMLEAAVALEHVQRFDASGAVYKNITMRWPEEEAAWLGLGNSLFALHKTDSAIRVLSEAVGRFPQSQALTNNYAHILFTSGRNDEARVMAQRALRMRGAYHDAAVRTLKAIDEGQAGNGS